jgi:hypothetical protein
MFLVKKEIQSAESSDKGNQEKKNNGKKGFL